MTKYSSFVNGDKSWHAPQYIELSAEEARNRLLTDEERREQDDAVRAARMGHNRLPDELDNPLAKMTPRQIYERCVWISDESTITKISLLALARYMRPDLQRGSSMSYSQLASDCGYSEPTAKRFAKDMAGRDKEKPRETFWLKVRACKGRYVPGKGHENLYWGVIPQKWEDELRRRKRAGIAIEPDEEIATMACSGVSERHPETEAPEGYPNPQTEVSHRYPDNGAGYQADTGVSERYPENPGPGYHRDTGVSERLDGVSQRYTNGGKTGDKKEEGADARADLFTPDGGPASADADIPKARGKQEERQEVKAAFDLYVETAKRCGLAVPRKVGPWLPEITARLREAGIDGWTQMLAAVEGSPFLRGENDRNFRADLDWLSGPKNFHKVLSGKYADSKRNASSTQPPRGKSRRAELDEA
jgi:hypothetical protein